MIQRLTVTMADDAKVTRNFSSQEELDEYLEYIAANGSWGKGEQTIFHPEVIDPETEEVLEEEYEEVIPAEYTYDVEDVTEEVEATDRMKSLTVEGAKARAACDAALDLVAGYNLSRELTPEQITQMTGTFGTIMMALSVERRPGKAKLLIEQVVPDGVIVTEEMKSDLLEILQDY